MVSAEEEAFCPSHYVLALAMVEDAVAVGSQGAAQCYRGVQLFTALIETDDAHLVGAGDSALIRFEAMDVGSCGQDLHKG